MISFTYYTSTVLHFRGEILWEKIRWRLEIDVDGYISDSYFSYFADFTCKQMISLYNNLIKGYSLNYLYVKLATH